MQPGDAGRAYHPFWNEVYHDSNGRRDARLGQTQPILTTGGESTLRGDEFIAAISESEMALLLESTPQCAPKVLDTADIVREGDVSTATLDLEAVGAAFVRVFLWHGSHAVVDENRA